MYTVLVLICSLAQTPDLSQCDRDNAVYMVQVPEQVSASVSCLMRGESYLAQTSIGRQMREDECLKVLCIRSSNAGIVG